METKEFKKVKRYDEYTINEFVKDLIDTRENVRVSKEDIAKKREELNQRIDEFGRKLEQENEMDHAQADETYSNLEQELSTINSEEEKVNSELGKWEAEKARIKSELEQKIENNKQTAQTKEQERLNIENTIKENEERIAELWNYSAQEANGMEDNSEELNSFEATNKSLKKKIPSLKGSITKANNAVERFNKIKENLEAENVIEGLEPPRDIKSQPKTLTRDEKYRAYIDKKAKETGYYSHARTAEETENFKKVIETEKEIRARQENEESEIEVESEIKVEDKENEIQGLEEQLRETVDRMKEYRENGNYDLEAAERATYSEIVSKINELRTETPIEEVKKREQTEQEIVGNRQPEVKQEAETVVVESNKEESTTEPKIIIPQGMKQRAAAKTSQAAKNSAATTEQANQTMQKEEPIVTKEEKADKKVEPKVTVQEPVKPQTKTKSYSEMTVEELKQKQKELYAKIVEDDDYYFRAHQENGMEGYEEDKIDAELKAIREELEAREAKKKETEEKWHPKLTKEQKQELIEEGIEPGDNEYNLYLWNHGINPFEKELEKAAKVQKEVSKEAVSGIEEEIKEEPAKKASLLRRILNALKEFGRKISEKINKFDQKLLGDGKEKQEEKTDIVEEKDVKEEKAFAASIKVPPEATPSIENIPEKDAEEVVEPETYWGRDDG